MHRMRGGNNRKVGSISQNGGSEDHFAMALQNAFFAIRDTFLMSYGFEKGITGCFQAWFKKGRIWVTKWKGGGGDHTKSCKTLLFESITHYNFNPYFKKNNLQTLCTTIFCNRVCQNA